MAEDKKKEIDVAVIEVTEEYLKEKLYKIRGKRVLLDADLAEIYGYDTKGFNRQVKNNIEKYAALLCTLESILNEAAGQYEDLMANHVRETQLHISN